MEEQDVFQSQFLRLLVDSIGEPVPLNVLRMMVQVVGS